jgi:hypothetical protein
MSYPNDGDFVNKKPKGNPESTAYNGAERARAYVVNPLNLSSISR